VLSEMFPEAPIYTLISSEEMGKRFENREIVTSYLQKFPKFLRKRYQWLLPFFMVAPETFDLRDFDLVISSSGAWSKGIVTRLNTVHISYLHSPMRFAWELKHGYIKGFFSRILMSYIRMWDKLSSERPDYLIANSKYTKDRIQKYYRRESVVIYPPAFDELRIMNYESSKLSSDKKHFLIVSRLSPYKKVDVAIEAFNKLGLPLVVIGEGKQKKYLEKIARDNIKILGFAEDEKLAEYYAKARAFIFPADDDFGITMVEALSFGLPVIAYKKGGALEIMEEGKNGEFFEAQTPEILADGVRRFMEKEGSYDKKYIVDKAKEFSKERFKKELEEFLQNILSKNS
jgi:glycosyltransferase involved in cell wall biosynthesis